MWLRNSGVQRAFMAAMLLLLPVSFAAAQSWPTSPIRWIVPVAPGGATDVVARLLQQPLQKILGQPIIVENMAGGSGIIATKTAVTASPAGYTYALIYTSHPANAAMRTDLPYDSIKDITPVAFLWRASLAIAVLPNSPLKTLGDLIDDAKREPGKITFATGGVGTAAHLAGALLEQSASIKLAHVPYRGAGPALTDFLGGQVRVFISNISVIAPYVADGKARVLAVTGPARSELLPGVPTVAESGFPGYAMAEWSGVIGPKGMSPAVVDRLNQAVAQVLAEPEIVAQYKQMGLEVVPMKPADFSNFIASETAKLADVIHRGGIKSE